MRVDLWQYPTAVRVIALVAVLLMAGCESASTVPRPSGPHANLVYTTWTRDALVTNGPEPGYRPVLSGLTSDDIASATVAIDPSGTTWVIYITFNTAGRDLLAKLTRANLEACPGDPSTSSASNCAQRHLTLWLGLSQADIDHWENSTFVGTITQPYDISCLAQAPAITTCPKFISDPITVTEIDGGLAAVAGFSSQQAAQDFANTIK